MTFPSWAAMTLAVTALATLPAIGQDTADALAERLETMEGFETLRTLTIAQHGEITLDHGYNGFTSTDPANIKSASKVIISTLVGIAIDRDLIESADQPIADFLADQFPDDPDPRLDDITIGNLMSMQAGLAATSGANYGRWVASRNWVRSALDQSFASDPGGAMIYSTGSTHLLSAILTEVGDASTRQLARDWLGPIEGFAITGWSQDPQGIHLGGNELAMTPLSLLAFGEMIRNGGVTDDGERIVSEDFIAEAWERRTRSHFTGHGYGYGWFLAEFAGHDTYYGWGYGGQMLYIVPDLDLTVVMTSDPDSPSGGNGYRDRLHGLMTDIIELTPTTD